MSQLFFFLFITYPRVVIWQQPGHLYAQRDGLAALQQHGCWRNVQNVQNLMLPAGCFAPNTFLLVVCSVDTTSVQCTFFYHLLSSILMVMRERERERERERLVESTPYLSVINPGVRACKGTSVSRESHADCGDSW